MAAGSMAEVGGGGSRGMNANPTEPEEAKRLFRALANVQRGQSSLAPKGVFAGPAADAMSMRENDLGGQLSGAAADPTSLWQKALGAVMRMR